MNLTPSQQSAIDRFKTRLERQCTEQNDRQPHYGAAVTKFEVRETDHKLVWIHAETEYAGLPETNMLRAVSHEYWHVAVGPNGSLVAWGYPKSYEQFAKRSRRGGKKVFGLRFRKA